MHFAIGEGKLQLPRKTAKASGSEGVDAQKSIMLEAWFSQAQWRLLELVSAGVCVSRLAGKGLKWILPAVLFLEMSLKYSCPSSTCPEIGK